MQKTILKVDKNTGEITETLRNQDLTNFVPFETEKFKYVFIEDTDTVSRYGYSVGPGDDKKSALLIEGDPIRDVVAETLQRAVSFPPTSEQSLSGTVYGTGFEVDEMVFQTTILPQVQNYYLVSGISQAAYNPVVATIGFTLSSGDTFGFVGRRCAEFKGTPSDSAGQAAATVVLPIEIDSTHLNHFLISGFLYLNTTPSTNYDPVVVGVVNNITAGTTADAWVVDIDSDTIKRVRFSWATTNDSVSGFPRSLYVTPTYGITLNQWHHWAVAYSNAGGSAAVSSYWNGIRTSYSTSGFSGSFRNNSNNRVSVGADKSGYYPLKGYLEDLMISGGTATESLRGFLHGATAPVPTTEQQAGQYTFAAMSMNGPLGESLFPCDVTNRVVSVCDGVFGGNVYVSGTVLETYSQYRSAKGLSAFSGVCGGHSPSAGTTGNSYLFGYDSGSCMIVSGVDTLLGLQQAKIVEGNRLELSYRTLFGGTAMYGFCGDTGPLKTLFSKYPTGYAGSTFSFLPIQTNIDALSTIYDQIVVTGSTATYYIDDAFGNAVTMGASGIVALYQDVITYFSDVTTEYNGVLAQINGATTQAGLKSVAGFTTERYIQTLAVLSKNDRSLYVKPENKLVADFKTSERVYVEGRYDELKGDPISVPVPPKGK